MIWARLHRLVTGHFVDLGPRETRRIAERYYCAECGWMWSA